MTKTSFLKLENRRFSAVEKTHRVFDLANHEVVAECLT